MTWFLVFDAILGGILLKDGRKKLLLLPLALLWLSLFASLLIWGYGY